LWQDADASTGARLRHAITHPAGHRPLPPGRDADAVVSAAKAFLLLQQQRQQAAGDDALAAAPA
jgi:hypothetical protein